MFCSCRYGPSVLGAGRPRWGRSGREPPGGKVVVQGQWQLNGWGLLLLMLFQQLLPAAIPAPGWREVSMDYLLVIFLYSSQIENEYIQLSGLLLVA